MARILCRKIHVYYNSYSEAFESGSGEKKEGAASLLVIKDPKV